MFADDNFSDKCLDEIKKFYEEKKNDIDINNVFDSRLQVTPLYLCVTKEAHKTLEWCLDIGCDPNRKNKNKDSYKDTALELAEKELKWNLYKSLKMKCISKLTRENYNKKIS